VEARRSGSGKGRRKSRFNKGDLAGVLRLARVLAPSGFVDVLSQVERFTE